MTLYLDILFFFIIILLLFLYSYVSQFKKMEMKPIQINKEQFEKENEQNNIDEYENDKYKDLYEDLPWDDFDDKCESDIEKKHNLDFISTVGLRKPKMVIW